MGGGVGSGEEGWNRKGAEGAKERCGFGVGIEVLGWVGFCFFGWVGVGMGWG